MTPAGPCGPLSMSARGFQARGEGREGRGLQVSSDRRHTAGEIKTCLGLRFREPLCEPSGSRPQTPGSLAVKGLVPSHGSTASCTQDSLLPCREKLTASTMQPQIACLLLLGVPLGNQHPPHGRTGKCQRASETWPLGQGKRGKGPAPQVPKQPAWPHVPRNNAVYSVLVQDQAARGSRPLWSQGARTWHSLLAPLLLDPFPTWGSGSPVEGTAHCWGSRVGA